jgi:hypothetical protein
MPKSWSLSEVEPSLKETTAGQGRIRIHLLSRIQQAGVQRTGSLRIVELAGLNRRQRRRLDPRAGSRTIPGNVFLCPVSSDHQRCWLSAGGSANPRARVEAAINGALDEGLPRAYWSNLENALAGNS